MHCQSTLEILIPWLLAPLGFDSLASGLAKTTRASSFCTSLCTKTLASLSSSKAGRGNLPWKSTVWHPHPHFSRKSRRVAVRASTVFDTKWLTANKVSLPGFCDYVVKRQHIFILREDQASIVTFAIPWHSRHQHATQTALTAKLQLSDPQRSPPTFPLKNLIGVGLHTSQLTQRINRHFGSCGRCHF